MPFASIPPLCAAAMVTTTRTHCPNCGAKLPEQPLSLCAYCAMPVDLVETPGEPKAASPNAERIRKVGEHESFAEALEWNPPESREYQASWRKSYRGRVMLFAAGLVLLAAWVFGGKDAAGEATLSTGVLALAAFLALVGVYLMVRAAKMRKEATALPLLRRPGVITDRRSETVLKGWGGSTCYYFTIELEDGVVAEFAYPGHGSNEAPYVTNIPGVAYTRGTTLLSFKHIRV